MEPAEKIYPSSNTRTTYEFRSLPRIVRVERRAGSTEAKKEITDSRNVGTTNKAESTSTRRIDGKGDGPGSTGNGPGKTDPSSANRSSTLLTLFGLFAASSIATIWAYTKETIFGLSTEFLKHALGGITALLLAISGAALMADHSPSTMADMQ